MLIETPRLLPREFEENDAHATNVYERDADVVRYQTFAPRSLAESLAYIEKSMASARELPRRIFDLALLLRSEQRLIGRCGLKVADVEGREGALWYILQSRLLGPRVGSRGSGGALGFRVW